MVSCRNALGFGELCFRSDDRRRLGALTIVANPDPWTTRCVTLAPKTWPETFGNCGPEITELGVRRRIERMKSQRFRPVLALFGKAGRKADWLATQC
jgi:hypothetical protein